MEEMKKLEGALLSYQLEDSADEVPMVAFPNEVFLVEEGTWKGSVCVKWAEEGVDPSSPDEVLMWLIRPAKLVLKAEKQFKYDEEPEHPEVDR